MRREAMFFQHFPALRPQLLSALFCQQQSRCQYAPKLSPTTEGQFRRRSLFEQYWTFLSQSISDSPLSSNVPERTWYRERSKCLVGTVSCCPLATTLLRLLFC